MAPSRAASHTPPAARTGGHAGFGLAGAWPGEPRAGEAMLAGTHPPAEGAIKARGVSARLQKARVCLQAGPRMEHSQQTLCFCVKPWGMAVGEGSGQGS